VPDTRALTILAVRGASINTTNRRQRSMDTDESDSQVVDQAEDESGNNGWEEAAGVRRTLYLPAELSRTLAQAAQEQGVTVNDLIVDFITQGLQRRGTYREGEGNG